MTNAKATASNDQRQRRLLRQTTVVVKPDDLRPADSFECLRGFPFPIFWMPVTLVIDSQTRSVFEQHGACPRRRAPAKQCCDMHAAIRCYGGKMSTKHLERFYEVSY